MLEIGFPIPHKENEKRRALIPCDVPQAYANRLFFERGYGKCLGISDDDYRAVGGIVAPRDRVCECPVVCSPKPSISDEYFRHGATVFGWIHAVQGRRITDALLEKNMTAIAWEDMFEGGRHTFWRNNELAGEAAIMHAAFLTGRMPYESLAAVIGRGNVARGAMRMLERLGCRVVVYNQKTVHLLRAEINQFAIVVNAVLWDVFRTDHLIYEEDLDRMKPGSLIVDISCDEGMGIQSSHPTTIADPVYVHKGILHYVVDHTPSLVFHSASESISKAVAPYIAYLLDSTPCDAITKATIIRDGQIQDDRITRFQKR